MRIIAQEIASQSGLRNYSEEVEELVRMYMTLLKGECMNQALILTEGCC